MFTFQITAEKPAPQKRHVPIQFDSSSDSSTKQQKPNKGSDGMKLYTPPSGKFSNSFQSYGNFFLIITVCAAYLFIISHSYICTA